MPLRVFRIEATALNLVEHQSDNPVNIQTLTQNAQNLHGISNMSETSWIEILLFLRTGVFIQSTYVLNVLVGGHPKLLGNFLIGCTTVNLENHSRTCVLPTTCFPKAAVMSSVCFFPV
jgi:hypothetical protein